MSDHVNGTAKPTIPSRTSTFDPIAINQLTEAVQNLQTTLSREALAKGSLIDPRRSIEDECGYPPIGMAVGADLLRMLYDRVGPANRVVQLMPKECFQVMPAVYETEDPAQYTPFEQAFDNLGRSLSVGTSYYADDEGSRVWEYLQRADSLSRIGQFGIILLGIDDGKNLQEPVDDMVELVWDNQPIKSPNQPDKAPASSSPKLGQRSEPLGDVEGNGQGPNPMPGQQPPFTGSANPDKLQMPPIGAKQPPLPGEPPVQIGGPTPVGVPPTTSPNLPPKPGMPPTTLRTQPPVGGRTSPPSFSPKTPPVMSRRPVGVKPTMPDSPMTPEEESKMRNPAKGAPEVWGGPGPITPGQKPPTKKVIPPGLTANEESIVADWTKFRVKVIAVERHVKHLVKNGEHVGAARLILTANVPGPLLQLTLNERRAVGQGYASYVRNVAMAPVPPLLKKPTRPTGPLEPNNLFQQTTVDQTGAPLDQSDDTLPSGAGPLFAKKVGKGPASPAADDDGQADPTSPALFAGGTETGKPLPSNNPGYGADPDDSRGPIGPDGKPTDTIGFPAGHEPVDPAMAGTPAGKAPTAPFSFGQKDPPDTGRPTPFGTATGEQERRPNSENPNLGRQPGGPPGKQGTDSEYDDNSPAWSAGYGIPPSAMSGTDQQYYGVQLGPSEQVVPDSNPTPKRLIFMRCYDESLVQVVRYEWNIRNPRFGLPVMYRVVLNDPREAHSGVGLPLATVFVHWSRVIHLADVHANAGSSEIFAPPVLRAVLNYILDILKVPGAAAEGYWQSGTPTKVFNTHPQLGGDVLVDRQEITDDVENLINSLQKYMIGKGGSWALLAPSMVDPTPYIEGLISLICMTIGCPVRVFKGSERGELASSQDDAAWNDRLRNRQNGYITPRIICPLIDRLVAVGVLPVPTEGYHVEWPDLDSLNDKDKAAIFSSLMTGLGAFKQSGIEADIPLPEILSKFTGGLFDEEEIQALTEATKQQQAQTDMEQQQQQQIMEEKYGFRPAPPPGMVDPEQQGREHDQAMAAATNPAGAQQPPNQMGFSPGQTSNPMGGPAVGPAVGPPKPGGNPFMGGGKPGGSGSPNLPGGGPGSVQGGIPTGGITPPTVGKISLTSPKTPGSAPPSGMQHDTGVSSMPKSSKPSNPFIRNAWTEFTDPPGPVFTANVWSEAARQASLEARRASVNANAVTMKTADYDPDNVTPGTKRAGDIGKKVEEYKLPGSAEVVAAHGKAMSAHLSAARAHDKAGETTAADAHRQAATMHERAVQAHRMISTNQAGAAGYGGGSPHDVSGESRDPGGKWTAGSGGGGSSPSSPKPGLLGRATSWLQSHTHGHESGHALEHGLHEAESTFSAEHITHAFGGHEEAHAAATAAHEAALGQAGHGMHEAMEHAEEATGAGHELGEHAAHFGKLDAGAILFRQFAGPAAKMAEHIVRHVPMGQPVANAIAKVHETSTKVAESVLHKLEARYGKATAGAILGSGHFFTEKLAALGGGPLLRALPGGHIIGAAVSVALAEVGLRMGLLGPDSKMEKSLAAVGTLVHAFKGFAASNIEKGVHGAAYLAGRAVGSTARDTAAVARTMRSPAKKASAGERADRRKTKQQLGQMAANWNRTGDESLYGDGDFVYVFNADEDDTNGPDKIGEQPPQTAADIDKAGEEFYQELFTQMRQAMAGPLAELEQEGQKQGWDFDKAGQGSSPSPVPGVSTATSNRYKTYDIDDDIPFAEDVL